MAAEAAGYVAAMGGRNGGSTRARAIVALFVAALASPALVACTTGQPSSESSWQSASDRAIGAAISGLGTARIVIEQERRDRLPHAYAVETVTDALESSSREISSYQVGQPPDTLHRANAAVDDALGEASSLLVDVRVAVASPGLTETSAHRLLTRIDALRDELDRLDDAVMEAPETVGAG
jgi:hypothetical protein